jgi:hypothetical protein
MSVLNFVHEMKKVISFIFRFATERATRFVQPLQRVKFFSVDSSGTEIYKYNIHKITV